MLKSHHRYLGMLWLVAPVAEARGACYGDCSGMGVAVLAVGPFALIYYKLWNQRKGGPSLGQAVGYFLLACAIAFGLGHLLLISLSLNLWAIWLLMGTAALVIFSLLVHPRRYEQRK